MALEISRRGHHCFRVIIEISAVQRVQPPKTSGVEHSISELAGETELSLIKNRPGHSEPLTTSE